MTTGARRAAEAFTLFDTAIGPCAVAWRGEAIVGVELPSAKVATTRARCRHRWPDAVEPTGVTPPAFVVRAAVEIAALLAGGRPDFSTLPLDLTDVPEFHRRVYDLTCAIPPGSTRTYGDIARDLGDVGASRAVGQALGRNPIPLIVPCHRVLAAGGDLRGFSGAGGIVTKRRLLAIEGASGVQLTLF
jgi:methylated-DNA-[protein]-cysteine S-methyltransferase